MFFYFCVCPSWFPPGIPARCNFASQSFKRRKHEIEASVLALCFKPCAVFDNLSLFAQSVGCPKRLIKIEPDQLSLKGLFHLKMLMHMHTHTRHALGVGGQWIPFDVDALSQFLGDPLVLEEGK